MSFVAERTREPLVRLGGAFMVSPEFAAREQAVGLPARTLYFRGRTAVLGDPEPGVVAALIGIFPEWLIEKALVRGLPADLAIEAYLGGCWDWSRTALTGAEDSDHLAELGFAVADAADSSGLALFRGWRDAPRPTDGPARLGHALMLLRELRGGLHFAALRAVGLSVTQAVALDPGGGRGRLMRTGWLPEDAEALLASVEGRDDLAARWRDAERLTDDRFDEVLAVLSPPEREKFASGLAALG
ncbi:MULTISPECIES: SCO6745 family protein [unclassified Saccharothrix]|uniref:SCO6745 family protein n=1 Tax=unclassified Saccharothrix TaxID=2593673 RepID=UPI00307E5073